MSATYHVCPTREWFASFKKLDGGLVSFGDGLTCHIEGIRTILIKIFDGTVRKLYVRYVPQLKKNIILVGALEAQGLKETLGKDILKMFSESLVVLKGI